MARRALGESTRYFEDELTEGGRQTISPANPWGQRFRKRLLKSLSLRVNPCPNRCVLRAIGEQYVGYSATANGSISAAVIGNPCSVSGNKNDKASRDSSGHGEPPNPLCKR